VSHPRRRAGSGQPDWWWSIPCRRSAAPPALTHREHVRGRRAPQVVENPRRGIVTGPGLSVEVPEGPGHVAGIVQREPGRIDVRAELPRSKSGTAPPAAPGPTGTRRNGGSLPGEGLTIWSRPTAYRPSRSCPRCRRESAAPSRLAHPLPAQAVVVKDQRRSDSPSKAEPTVYTSVEEQPQTASRASSSRRSAKRGSSTHCAPS
jgi:hypothetical protein